MAMEEPTVTSQKKVVNELLKEMGLADTSGEKTLAKEHVPGSSFVAEPKIRRFDLPFIDLGKVTTDPVAVELVPEAMARKYLVIPLTFEGDYLILAMADPGDMDALETIAVQTGKKIRPVQGEPEDIKRAINLYYRAGVEIEKQVAKLPFESKEQQNDGDGRLATIIAQTPVARIVDLLIEQAVKDRASDIHIEPQENGLDVRCRVDGLLQIAASLPISLHPALVSRIKVLAGMNIAERRRPQDGQFCSRVGSKDIDIRVATSESFCGEMMVLRILDKSVALFDLSELGFMAGSLDKYKKLLARKFGLILVSGPTGSGKTTTLYASINTMDKKHQNIITLEDPIEYRFHGINQMQVNNKAGLTFATGLRAIMRLDPNVILVGEIRDPETAKMAVQAALTGHLVLSTIHANDTAAVLLRLLDLEVEPFLIWSAVAGVVAYLRRTASLRAGNWRNRAIHPGRRLQFLW
ncbi:MAG: gspE [Dehalococcoidia bacterium]|nr:gspE [Dehalococcoidia bacterium]